MAVADIRKEFLESRRAGIGGSDIAGILGKSPYIRPIDVWLAKTKRTHLLDAIDNDAQYLWWGNALEDLIARRYSEVTRYALKGDVGILQHDKHPIILGSPDRLVVGQPRGLEIKNAGFKGPLWGEPGTDELPEHYLIQCAWYMAVTGLERWDLAVLFGGNRCEIYHVHRDLELEDMMVDAGLQFWHDYVATDKEPPLDSSDRYGAYLAKKFATGTDRVIPIAGELRSAAEDLYKVRKVQKMLEEREQMAKNFIMAAIGENRSAQDPSFKLTMVRSKPGRATDWKAAFLRLIELVADTRKFNQIIELGDQAIKEHSEPAQRAAYLKATFAGDLDAADAVEAAELAMRAALKELVA